MRIIKEAGDLKGKKVLLRADLDVPVADSGGIEESFRIKRQKNFLDYLIDAGAKVVIVAHISDESVGRSFGGLMPQLNSLLGREINFIKNIAGVGEYLDKYVGPALLDNIRQNEGEEKNDPDFARRLAAGFDIYANNDFAVCHRDHASVSGIAKILPGYAGPVVEAETAQLQKAVSAPSEGKVVIIGGAKGESKVPVIKNLLERSESVLTGGVVANDILMEKGQDMGSSVVDSNFHDLLMNLNLNDSRLKAPEDFIVFDDKILDIGDQTMKKYMDIIEKARMIIWNGPMGLFENPVFAKGTNEIAQAILRSPAEHKIVGGGDTITAIDKAGLLGKFEESQDCFISTGGGAMLAFLSGDVLPGLEVLK